MTATINTRWVHDELRRRGYPFGKGRDARARWAKEEMLSGRLQRDAITEKMAQAGMTPNQIARVVGISGEKVIAHLVARPTPELDESLDIVLYRGGPPADLETYRTHVEKFGPEMVLETAQSDLPVEQLGELSAFIDSMERTHRWKDGEWVPRRERAE